MFPNESSSDEISSKTNAFVQNCEEEGVAVSTALVVQWPLGSTFPTNQVPDLRDTIDCSAENDASMKTAPCTLNPCRSNTLHTGCEPCALPVEAGTEGGGAGPLTCPPASLPLSSVSVITSSTHRETLPPSHTTISGALQSPDGLFASHHHGSSSSNSLYCAQIQTFHHQNHSHITDSQASNATTSNHDNIATETNHVKRLNTGALSVQDNNNNNFVKINNNNSNNDNKNSIKDGSSARNRSSSPQNIPQSKPYSIITVQGNDVTQRSFKCDDYASRWGIPHACRLLGGGESSLSAGASGWTNTNNNNTNTAAWTSGGTNTNGQQQTPNSGSQTQPQQQSQWANSNNNNPAPNQRSAGNNNTSPSSQQSSGNSGMKNSGNSVSGSGGPTTIQQQPPTSQQQTQQQPQQQSGNSNTSGQQQTQNGSGTWAQAAGKGLPPANPPSSGSVSTTSTSNTTGTSTKQQLEQLNSMREALFSQDGWGGQHVNQDSGWDVPQSPEPGGKDSNGAPMAPVWKPTVNNGTDLWEANLRNGGQPPPQVAQKAPWGHTPTSNIGGTWGEDDDMGDSSNVWTGVPSGQSGGGQWGNNAGPQPMWGGPKKESDWTGVGSSSNWGEPRDIRSAAASTMDPRDIRADLRSAMVDHRDPMRSVMDHSVIPNRGMVSGDVMMRGDSRGISGRLTGGAGGDPAMWGAPPQQPPHHHVPHHQQAQPPNKMVAPNVPGVNQWPGPPPKDMGMPVGSVAKPTGWEEPSPPAQRRNIPNYDDGTSLWGGQQRAAVQGQSKVSHWKEMPTANMGRGMQCPPGMPQNRMAANNMKPETPLWGHPTRNGSWGEGPHEVGGGAPWGDDKVSGSGGLTPWNDPSLPSWGAQKPKNSMNPSWVDGDVDPTAWGHPPKQPPKPMTKEIIWSSKQFRILSDMGFKKEEVENALRVCAMSLEDALEYLNATRSTLGGGDAWRGTRHSEMEPPFDHSNPPAFPAQRFNPQQMQFAPPGGGSGNAPNLLNNVANQNLNNLSPALVQKILQPPPQQPPSQQTAPYNQTSRNPQNQPSTQQLRMLVQQIQMAVQAGYLNHQILNQPLAPQTLILLNQLLQQIKLLQQLMQQQAMIQVQPLNKGSSNTVLHLSVQITKSKQQIHNLQNQIAAQQAIYVKQQQHQIAPQQGDFFKTNLPDPLSALQSNFSDLGINKEPQHTSAFQSQQQGSRLNQWKLPSLDKDGEMSGNNEFSRAPGTTTKPQGGSTSPNINPLLGQGDGTWSSVGRSNSDTGWPDSSNVESDNKDWPVTTTQSSSQAFTDLVPEFEPGKPWKGNQMKSIEDDPSITPGSVVRSPLSLATIKDTEIFNSGVGGSGGGGGKTSPTGGVVDMPIPPLSLSSSTWTFNPPASTASSFTSPLGKLSGSKSTWGEAPPPSVSSELWGVPKSRPPPGLSSKAAPAPTNGSTSSSSNGWGSLGRWGPQTNPSSWNSSWLFLRNLTPQIDGSTLKTLCVQHGPLQNFHLYLNHGIALAKYSTRDEAIKAQGALNNCVLGNTTIFAESLGENDVQQLLQHLSQQSSGGGGWGLRGGATPNQGSGPKGAPPSDTWGSGSQLWAPANSGGGSLWTPLEPPSDQHRSTPSSLNSFLPGDLLGSSDPM